MCIRDRSPPRPESVDVAARGDPSRLKVNKLADRVVVRVVVQDGDAVLFGDGREQEVGQAHVTVSREPCQGSLNIQGPMPVLGQDRQVLIGRLAVHSDLLVVLRSPRAQQRFEVQRSTGSDQAGSDQRGYPFGNPLVMHASRCAGVHQVAGNYRHTRARSSLSAKAFIDPLTNRSTSRRRAAEALASRSALTTVSFKVLVPSASRAAATSASSLSLIHI